MEKPEDCQRKGQIDYEETWQRVAEGVAASAPGSKPHEIFEVGDETADHDGGLDELRTPQRESGCCMRYCEGHLKIMT